MLIKLWIAGALLRSQDAVTLYGFTMLILSSLSVAAGPCLKRGYLRVVVGIAEQVCGEYEWRVVSQLIIRLTCSMLLERYKV